MADPSARRRGPLDAAAPASVALAPPATRFVFRGSPEAARLCGEAFGCPLPTEACRAERRESRAALWLGPDEWLLLAPVEAAPEALGAALSRAATAVPHALVDVSHRQIGLAVTGPGAATLLNAGCPLDLHPAAFPVGTATRTMLAKAEIVLWRQGEAAFHLEVWRSFAPYVVGFLRMAEPG